MSLLYLVIKLYPLFGLAMLILSFDLARSYRRRANPLWMAFASMTVFFLVTVALWLIYRGDLNSERWFADFTRQIRG